MYDKVWLDYMADAAAFASLLAPRPPFSERRQGLCGTNTADDRRRRKERARELTRLNMEKKGQTK